jgi:hypothetical protein
MCEVGLLYILSRLVLYHIKIVFSRKIDEYNRILTGNTNQEKYGYVLDDYGMV